MRESHSDHRYIRVEDRIDPMAKGDISLDQMIGRSYDTGRGTRQNYQANRSRGNFRGNNRQDSR